MLEQDRVYHLAADVANPHPDRRKKNWQDKPSYPAGYYKAVTWADNSAGRRADHLGIVPVYEDGKALPDCGILHRVAWPEQYDLLVSKLVPACLQVCGEWQVYYRPAGPDVVPVQMVQPFSVVEDKQPAPDTSLLGSLHRLLDFVVNGERYETRNPYTLDVVKSAQSALKRATDREHDLRRMHKLTAHVIGRAVQTLIEDAILAGLTPNEVQAELQKLCGYNPQPNYADLVQGIAGDIQASCECAPDDNDVSAYLDGLANDVRGALAAARHVGDICPACRSAVLEDESATLKAGCPACGRAFTLAHDHHPNNPATLAALARAKPDRA
jgi:hypothetical protein